MTKRKGKGSEERAGSACLALLDAAWAASCALPARKPARTVNASWLASDWLCGQSEACCGCEVQPQHCNAAVLAQGATQALLRCTALRGELAAHCVAWWSHLLSALWHFSRHHRQTWQMETRQRYASCRVYASQFACTPEADQELPQIATRLG
jgi:hypothetical protein